VHSIQRVILKIQIHVIIIKLDKLHREATFCERSSEQLIRFLRIILSGCDDIQDFLFLPHLSLFHIQKITRGPQTAKCGPFHHSLGSLVASCGSLSEIKQVFVLA
jgi:hypothetical protein